MIHWTICANCQYCIPKRSSHHGINLSECSAKDKYDWVNFVTGEPLRQLCSEKNTIGMCPDYVGKITTEGQ